MQTIIKAALLSTACLISAGVAAQSPSDIFAEMDSRKRASLNGVQNYSQMKSMMGICALEYYEKSSTQSVDGRGTVEYMRLVPISEITSRRSEDKTFSDMSPEQLEAIAGQIRSQGPAMESAMRDEMQSAGLSGGLGEMIMNPPPNEPWLSANPNDMMGMYGTMLEAAAEGKRQDAAMEAEARTEAQTDPFAEIAKQTRIVGREKFRDRDAVVMVADGLNHTQVSDGQEFTIQKVTLWIDEKAYLPLKMRMDGIAREGNETRELRIEREDSDYRTVPGCQSMNEPFRTVMRVAGILNEEQQAEMVEAQKQLAQMDSQLASLPASQRDMIMRQMGPQMEMLRGLASGEGIEIVSEVTAMSCNAGLPAQEAYFAMMPGSAASNCSSPGANGPGAFSMGAPNSTMNATNTAPADVAMPASAPAPEQTAGRSADDLAADQKACLEDKIAKAQESKKKKRGFGRLASAVARTAGRLGNHDVSRTLGDVYSANATADDLSAAAKDLGLTEDDIAACENPN
ncbi:MAG: hypothetical protein RIA65_11405 [Woeseia sp.]